MNLSKNPILSQNREMLWVAVPAMYRSPTYSVPQIKPTVMESLSVFTHHSF